jgi:hypothetical protein
VGRDGGAFGTTMLDLSWSQYATGRSRIADRRGPSAATTEGVVAAAAVVLYVVALFGL